MSRVPRKLGALRRDERGVSALEFALVAPMFILIFFGLIETGQVLTAARRTGHAANVLSDLIAQKGTVVVADVTDSFAAGVQMVAPMSVAGLKMKVTSVTMQSNGKATVDWSRSYNGLTADTKGAVAAVPANLVTATGESVVVATATYSLAQVSKYVLVGPFTFNRVSYAKPRSGTQVTCPTC